MRGRQSCAKSRGTRRGGLNGGYSGAGALHASPIGATTRLLAPVAEAAPRGPAPSPNAGGRQAPPSPPVEPPARAETPGKAGLLPSDSGETVTDPIDPRFLTNEPFGSSSFWLQPWRAYLDTWPASKLLESVGINFNVGPAQAEATAQLLQDSGFKLARVAINWAALSYEDPNTFIPEHLASITARLTALRNHGLRPLIVLDAYSGAPAPMRHVTLETTAPAAAGARTVTLTPASAALVVDGKTGFNYLTPFKGTPDVLITSVTPAGVATLSRPLPQALAAGAHGGTTLLYGPFAAPTLPGGQPNPQFQETLSGWLSYVGAVSRLAGSIVGPGGFDLEIWNELTFGSQFLNAENYHSTGEETSEAAPSTAAVASTGSQQGGSSEAAGARSTAAPESQPGVEEGSEGEYSSDSNPSSEGEYSAESEPASEAEDGPEGEEAAAEPAAQALVGAGKAHRMRVNREIRKAILFATVAYVRDPSHGISPSVAITDGFASQTPFPSGANSPLGLTALSKHPYVSARSFPSGFREDHIFPLNAVGARDTLKGSFKPLFVPAYQSLLPEYTLTAASTETLARDLAPMTTDIYRYPHGREVGPRGGSPVQKWITEYNLSPAKAAVVGPDGITPPSGASAELSVADKAHFQAKALLRSLVAMINKGMSREYFFAAAPGSLSLIDSSFFSALEANHGSYPGDQLGGETMASFRSLLAAFQGPGPGSAARQLKLDAITQAGNHAQFAGDGTSAHPALYDRDVFAVLPFQSSPTRFVIPVYVMTRDLLTLYEPGAPASDPTRFDLPNESFRITLSNLPETAGAPDVAAFDPLRRESSPARLVSHEGSSAVFEVAASDYPRLLSIDYTGK